MKIAYRQWDNRTIFYVYDLPGNNGGVDWGYTKKASKAMPLTDYWCRRFAADCRRVGSEAKFLPIGGEK